MKPEGKRKIRQEMRKRHQKGFAELMIVNPVEPGSGSILLGDDGCSTTSRALAR
jgi:hypothetical protein